MRRTRTLVTGSVVLTAVLLLAAGWALADGVARPCHAVRSAVGISSLCKGGKGSLHKSTS